MPRLRAVEVPVVGERIGDRTVTGAAVKRGTHLYVPLLCNCGRRRVVRLRTHMPRRCSPTCGAPAAAKRRGSGEMRDVVPCACGAGWGIAGRECTHAITARAATDRPGAGWIYPEAMG